MAKSDLKCRGLVVTVEVRGCADVFHYLNIGGIWHLNGSLRPNGTLLEWIQDKSGFWNDENLTQILEAKRVRLKSLKEIAKVYNVPLRKLRPYMKVWTVRKDMKYVEI